MRGENGSSVTTISHVMDIGCYNASLATWVPFWSLDPLLMVSQTDFGKCNIPAATPIDPARYPITCGGAPPALRARTQERRPGCHEGDMDVARQPPVTCGHIGAKGGAACGLG